MVELQIARIRQNRDEPQPGAKNSSVEHKSAKDLGREIVFSLEIERVSSHLKGFDPEKRPANRNAKNFDGGDKNGPTETGAEANVHKFVQQDLGEQLESLNAHLAIPLSLQVQGNFVGDNHFSALCAQCAPEFRDTEPNKNEQAGKIFTFVRQTIESLPQIEPTVQRYFVHDEFGGVAAPSIPVNVSGPRKPISDLGKTRIISATELVGPESITTQNEGRSSAPSVVSGNVIEGTKASFLDQIVTRLRAVAEVSTRGYQLSPEGTPKLQIEMQTSNNGQINIVVQESRGRVEVEILTEAGKMADRILSDKSLLRETFERAGYVVDDIRVSVAREELLSRQTVDISDPNRNSRGDGGVSDDTGDSLFNQNGKEKKKFEQSDKDNTIIENANDGKKVTGGIYI